MEGDELFAFEHCNPVKTVATPYRAVLNAEKYTIVQLMIFGNITSLRCDIPYWGFS